MSEENLINRFLDNGLLLSPDLLDKNQDIDKNLFDLYSELDKTSFEKPIVITKDFFKNIIKNNPLQNIENKNEDLEKKDIIIFKSYNKKPDKRTVKDFVEYFRRRYESLKEILINRRELQNVISISRLSMKKKGDFVSIIGSVLNKKATKNGNFILSLEDLTGKFNIIINKDRKSFKICKYVVEDEVIGVSGVMGDNIIFVNELYFPEVPITKEFKKGSEEVYAVFISDLHVGSNLFLEKEFLKFINWLNCKGENEEHKKIAKLVKYLFITGDLVDGIGVYPNQEKELLIKDIYLQYKKCAELISQIRKDIKIIICPGNHDAVRISEPQPPLDSQFAKDLCELSNIFMVSNPCFINIQSDNKFGGFDVLMYHGESFDYYYLNVDELRLNDAMNKPEIIMKMLLQKRHLAPTHGATLYIPDVEEDPLVIKRVPDFFVAGHVHKLSNSTYNNISIICSSCWQLPTAFQEKNGHRVDPCKVAVVNLKNRKVEVLNFI